MVIVDVPLEELRHNVRIELARGGTKIKLGRSFQLAAAVPLRGGGDDFFEDFGVQRIAGGLIIFRVFVEFVGGALLLLVSRQVAFLVLLAAPAPAWVVTSRLHAGRQKLFFAFFLFFVFFLHQQTV